MKYLKNLRLALIMAVLGVTLFSCSKDDVLAEETLTPSQLLSSTAWETTNAKNNKGENVVLTDANVSNFVGFAYFKADGSFTMYNLDNSPKMHGD